MGFLVVALVAGACVGNDDEAEEGPEEVARAFWVAMCEGDFQTAHGLLSAPAGTGLPSEANFVTAMQRRFPGRTGAENPTCQSAQVAEFVRSGDSSGTAKIRLETADGSGLPVEDLPMLQRDGRWHVHLSAALDLE